MRDRVNITIAVKYHVMYGLSPWRILKVNVKSIHILNYEYLGNCDRYSRHYYCHQMASHVWPLGWHIYNWPWKILRVEVKGMQIWNILERMIERIKLLFPSNSNSCMGFRLGYLHLIDLCPFWRSRSTSCISHQWMSWKRWQIGKALLLQANRKSCICFRIFIFMFDLDPFYRLRSRSCIFRMQIC